MTLKDGILAAVQLEENDVDRLRRIYDATFRAMIEAAQEADRLSKISVSYVRTLHDVDAFERQRTVLHKKIDEYKAARAAMIDAGLLKLT